MRGMDVPPRHCDCGCSYKTGCDRLNGDWGTGERKVKGSLCVCPAKPVASRQPPTLAIQALQMVDRRNRSIHTVYKTNQFTNTHTGQFLNLWIWTLKHATWNVEIFYTNNTLSTKNKYGQGLTFHQVFPFQKWNIHTTKCNHNKFVFLSNYCSQNKLYPPLYLSEKRNWKF